MSANVENDIAHLIACRDRRRITYDEEERLYIDPHKNDYMKADGPANKKLIATTKIFPPLFNFWREKRHMVFTDDEKWEKVLELIGWMRNNWRPESTDSQQRTFTVKRTKVVWMDHWAKVFEEIARLLDIPKADTHTPGWFGKLSKALSNVTESLSQQELDLVDVKIEKIRQDGFPEDEQKRLAIKHAKTRMDGAALNNYLEMGVLAISFVTYVTPTDQLAILVYDPISELLGASPEKLETQYPDEIRKMQRLVTQYVNRLRGRSYGPAGSSGQRSKDMPQVQCFQLDNKNYPRLVDTFRPSTWKKADLEKAMREYLSAHYSVATKGKKHMVPYTDLSNDLATYIEKQYLPPKFSICDPRNMPKESIVAFFKHIAEREVKYNSQNVFHFKNVNIARSNKTRPDGPDAVKPAYGADVCDAGDKTSDARKPIPLPKRKPCKPKKAGKDKTVPGEQLITFDHQPVPETGPSSTNGQNTGCGPDIPQETIYTSSAAGSHNDILIDPILLALSIPPRVEISPAISPTPSQNPMKPGPIADILAIHHPITPARPTTIQTQTNARQPQFGSPYTFPPSDQMTPMPYTPSDMTAPSPQPQDMTTPSRRATQTSDSRALNEAQKFLVRGKRQPRARKRY